jgi:hypothetical protein
MEEEIATFERGYDAGFLAGYIKCQNDVGVVTGKNAERFLENMKKTEEGDISEDQKKFLDECMEMMRHGVNKTEKKKNLSAIEVLCRMKITTKTFISHLVWIILSLAFFMINAAELESPQAKILLAIGVGIIYFGGWLGIKDYWSKKKKEDYK